MGALACVLLGLGRDEWSGCAEGGWFDDVIDEETNGMVIILVVVVKCVVVGVRRCKKTRGVMS